MTSDRLDKTSDSTLLIPGFSTKCKGVRIKDKSTVHMSGWGIFNQGWTSKTITGTKGSPPGGPHLLGPVGSVRPTVKGWTHQRTYYGTYWNLLSNHRMEPIFSTYTRSLFRGMYRFNDRANSPSHSWSPSSSRSHSLILNFFFSFFFQAPRPTATTVPLLSLNLTYDPDPTTRSNTSNQTKEKQENQDQGQNRNTYRNPM